MIEGWQQVVDLAREGSAMLGAKTGIDLAPHFLFAVPFLLPLLLALIARSLTSTLVTLLLAATVLLADQPLERPEPFFVSTALAFSAALLAAINTLHRQRRHVASEIAKRQLSEDLQGARSQLERERFWRRASGDDRDSVPDDEILRIAEQTILHRDPAPVPVTRSAARMGEPTPATALPVPS